MNNSDELASSAAKHTMPTPSAPPAAAGDVENQTPAEIGTGNSTGTGVSNILKKWRRDDLLTKGSLGLRGIGLILSFLAFIITATNKHGDGQNFNNYEEYRYVLAIAILSTLYTGFQVLRQLHELSTGKELFSKRALTIVDFSGDQVMAYFLISSASSAVPLTNRMREAADNIFTDSSAAAISMAFLAFLALALSALVSGYKLSNQSYI